MLMSAGIELPRKVWVHGWLLAAGGDRMSKSRGNMLDPSDVVAALGADGARYVTLREVAFDRDTEVSWDSFVRRYNADLANDFGNLVNRSITMAGRYLGGDRPAPRAAADAPLAAAWATALAGYSANLESLLLHEALASLWAFVGEANKFVETEQPWALAKSAKAGGDGAPAAEARLRGVLGDLVEAVRLVSLAVAPFMPSLAPRAMEQLGYAYPYGADGNGGPALADQLGWGAATPDGDAAGRLGTPTPLFPRLDVETAPD
jgi:methionyl-tRNA synthetase